MPPAPIGSLFGGAEKGPEPIATSTLRRAKKPFSQDVKIDNIEQIVGAAALEPIATSTLRRTKKVDTKNDLKPLSPSQLIARTATENNLPEPVKRIFTPAKLATAVADDYHQSPHATKHVDSNSILMVSTGSDTKRNPRSAKVQPFINYQEIGTDEDENCLDTEVARKSKSKRKRA